MKKKYYNIFGIKESKKRAGYIACIILIISVGVVLRLFWLQIIRGSDLDQEAKAQIAGVEVELSPRGSILDCNGEVLALSIVSKSLYVNPQEMEDTPDNGKLPARDVRRIAAKLLAPVLEMKEEELYQDFCDPDRRFIWVKRTLDPAVSNKVENIIQDKKINGFHFQEESKRYYTKNTLAAQVLGFVGTDDKGLEGIEASQDKLLKGKAVEQSGFFDARGQRMGESSMNQTGLSKMNTIYLTIDSKIQFILERSLDDAIEKTMAQAASIVLMNPHSGEILGMASRPTFDPNNFAKYKPSAWLNRAVSTIYEPGSVFKPIIGCAGLMEHLITPDTQYNDLGELDVGGRMIKNWNGKGVGLITFTDIIKNSVNTGMASLGLRLGGEKMTSYAKKFGFGEPTGSDVPGEEAGILYNHEEMVPSDVASMAIGQGIAVTPLQMLTGICAIANGGELLRPYIIKKIVAPDGTVLQENNKHVVRRVITEQVAVEMRGMMEQVVSTGGGRQAQIQGYKIAGKTGTAEKLAEGGGYAEGVYIASFVGFVPSDKPEYAMLIMLDSPKGAFYGSQVSAPVFRDTLQQILVAKGIQPSSSEGLPSVESLELYEETTEDLPQIEQLGEGRVSLPNLFGLNMRQVMKVLQRGKLILLPEGSGRAVRQEPAEGRELQQGDTVKVWFR